jgi:hypothetical protein
MKFMKFTATAVAAVMAFACAANAGAVNVSAASGLIQSGSYELKNVYSGTYLSFSNRNVVMDDEAKVWDFDWVSHGTYYTIVPDDKQNLSLTSSGDQLVLRAANDSDSQKWRLIQSSGRYINITPLDDDSVALSVDSDGNLSLEDSSVNSMNMMWQFASVSVVTPSPTPTPAPVVRQVVKPESNIDPVAGTNGGANVTLSCDTNGAIIYYTLDRTDPASSSTRVRYTAPFRIYSPATVEAVAVKAGYKDSDKLIFTYNSTPAPSPTPTPMPPSQTVIALRIGELAYTKNGGTMSFDVAPYMETSSGRTMVPIRYIAEAMGASVYWNNDTQTDTISLDGRSMNITVGKLLPNDSNGNTMGMAALIHDRLFVPVRYVSEQLGANVSWDPSTSTVTITK